MPNIQEQIKKNLMLTSNSRQRPNKENTFHKPNSGKKTLHTNVKSCFQKNLNFIQCEEILNKCNINDSSVGCNK